MGTLATFWFQVLYSRSLIREAAKNNLLALFTDTEGVVNANDSNLDVLLSNISQPVRFVFWHEEHGTFGNGDVDGGRFGLIRELPASHSYDDLVVTGIHFVKSEPGASLTRVSINCERSTGALALLLLMPEAQLQLTADDDTPQPQLPLGKI